MVACGLVGRSDLVVSGGLVWRWRRSDLSGLIWWPAGSVGLEWNLDVAV